MSVPMLDLRAQFASIRGEVMTAIAAVMESQHFVLGATVKDFEDAMADYCGCAHAVGVSSGTDALSVALMAEGIGTGDEVITSPYSFFATAGCISRAGARPVFVDIEPDSYNIDAGRIESVVTEKTRAIMPVSLYGQMADMDRIMDIASRYDLVVIEDSAQAVGADYKGRRAGSISHYGCFSFYPTKNLGGAGDGGMVTTNDDDRRDRLRTMREHGEKTRYHHHVVGGNFRLDALQAAVLHVKLGHLEGWTAARRAHAENYRGLFRNAGLAVGHEELGRRSGVVLPEETESRRHVYHQFVIRVQRRDELREFLQARNVGSAVYYPVPCHLQECFAELGFKEGDFPVSEAAARETLALPIYPELTVAQLEEVVDAIRAFLRP